MRPWTWAKAQAALCTARTGGSEVLDDLMADLCDDAHKTIREIAASDGFAHFGDDALDAAAQHFGFDSFADISVKQRAADLDEIRAGVPRSLRGAPPRSKH